MKNQFVKPEVGDRLLMVSTQSAMDPQTVEVTKIGRVWGSCVIVYDGVHDGMQSTRQYQFDLDSGFEKSGIYSTSWRLVTHKQLEAESRQKELFAALKDAGFDHPQYKRSDWITNEALEELLQVIDKHKALAIEES